MIWAGKCNYNYILLHIQLTYPIIIFFCDKTLKSEQTDDT